MSKGKTNSKPVFIISLILCALLLLFVNKPACKAQANDSLAVDTSSAPKRNPKLAAAFSAVIPGLGQAYNRKYWKIPIIYTGFAGFGYFLYFFQSEFKTFKTAYTYRTDDDPDTIDEFVETSLTATDLKTYREEYRRYRDMCFIGTAGFYMLNVLDAVVDANLFDYDISEDLSIRIIPGSAGFGQQSGNLGVRCVFYLK